MDRRSKEPKEFDEKVIRISRVSKKTKGGNQISFTALVVIGDRKGRVGVGLGKGRDVLSGIKKGVRKAKKRLIGVPLVDGRTIPHIVNLKFGAAHLLLKPAPKGTGVIAGGSVRSVLELAGVRDVVAKTLGSNNKLGNVTAAFNALKLMKTTVETKKKLGQTTLSTSTPPKPSTRQAPQPKKPSSSPQKTVTPKKTASRPVSKKTTPKPTSKSTKPVTSKKGK